MCSHKLKMGLWKFTLIITSGLFSLVFLSLSNFLGPPQTIAKIAPSSSLENAISNNTITPTLYLPVVIKPASNVGGIPILLMPQPDGKSNISYYPFRIFDAEPPEIEVPTLQQLAPNAESDQEIIDSVVNFYEENADSLQKAWRENNPERVKALLSMYIIHTSHLYGQADPSSTFRDYLESKFSNCGPQALYQAKLLDGFGLKWQHVAISNGFHGWIEVEIDGHWEIFDSTTNVWIDHSAFKLIEGQSRRYRLFYTPWTDANLPEARQIISTQGMTAKDEPIGYTPGTLRLNMPGFGIFFVKKDYTQTSKVRLEVWEKSGLDSGNFQEMLLNSQRFDLITTHLPNFKIR